MSFPILPEELLDRGFFDGLMVCALVLALFLLLKRTGRRPIVLAVAFSIAVVFVLRWTEERWNLLPVALALAAVWLRARSTAISARISGLLEGRTGILVAGVAASLTALWILGSLDPIPSIHDEASYVLQARLFAAGHWKAPAPPLPEFFEQMHVLVTPFYASKYFPGQAMTLVPGVLLGLPGLMPVLLAGVTAALVFWLAKRVAGAPVAWLATALWITAPVNHELRPSYFSELTSGACLLLAWACFLRWRESGEGAWLVGVALSVGWGALTRPYSMFLLGLPIVLAALVRGVSLRQWSALAMSGAAGLLVLLLIPVWSRQTTGDWRTTPLSLYTRMYMPYDLVAFGQPFRAPSRMLPPDLASADLRLRRSEKSHETADLLVMAQRRMRAISGEVFGGWRWLLILPALFGVIALGAEGFFALSSAGLLFVGHLRYWHHDFWTPYYQEIYPVLCFVTAVGIWWGICRLLKVPGGENARGHAMSAGREAAIVFAIFVVLFGALPDLVRIRGDKQREVQDQSRFRETVRSLPDDRAIVFVRYASGHNADASLIDNDPVWFRSRAWVVYDRGAENERLMRLAPERVPYLFDEESGMLERLRRP